MVAANISQLIQVVVHITQACPKTASDWKTASDKLGCHINSPDIKNRYHCVPNEYRSMLLEFCYNRARTLVQAGYCLEITKSGSLNFVKCKDNFSYGCPAKEYYSDEIYNHSACLEVNTHQKCFVANQECEKPLTSPKSVQEYNTYVSVQERKSDTADVIIALGTILGIVLIGIIVVLIIKRKDIFTYIRGLMGQQNQEEVFILTPTTPRPDEPPAATGQQQPCTPLLSRKPFVNENKDGEANTPEKEPLIPEPSSTQVPEENEQETVIDEDGQDVRSAVEEIELVTVFTTTSVDENQDIIAAIDLGTSYSGYCFSSEADYTTNPLKIATHKWTFSWLQAVSLKTPTTILLDKDKKIHSFGFDAETEYAEMDECSHEDYFYFQRFKMALNDIDCTKGMDINIKDIRGKELPATLVFSQCIRYLKDQLLDSLNRKSLENIYWVLTYPSLWDIDKQRVLKNSAVEAGIPSNNIAITEEASVVSYYLHHLPYCLKDNNIFKEGTKYLLLDAGGGTVDLTINEIQLDRASKTLIRRSCPYGGTTVDKAFERTICDVIGDKLMAQFIQKHTSDYIEMLRNFEAVKRKPLPKYAKNVLLRIPITLTQIYEENNDHRIGEKIKQTKYNEKVTWEDDKFRMTTHFFTSLFDEAFKGIKFVIRDLLNEDKAKGTKTILMAGGFSESSQLYQMMRDEFTDLDVNKLPEPGLAVLRGAVLYGHQPVVFHPSIRNTQCMKSR